MPARRLTLVLVPCITLILIMGCAGMKRPMPPVATLTGSPDRFRIGQILDLGLGKAVSFDEMMDRIAQMELVFVGEVHDNPEHHLIQVQILMALAGSSGPPDIAMEFFQRSHQQALDRYLMGELNEEELLREVDWNRTWGHGYHFYRPLLLWAKQNRARVLAVNAPIDIVRKVAREGIGGLSALERGELAERIHLEDNAHRAYLEKIYGLHIHRDLKRFDYFYQAQCVWEDTMAEAISDYFRDGGTRLVVFAGNGHIVNRFGIPDRTTGRIRVSSITIMPCPLSENLTLKREAADYVWLTPAFPHRFMMVHRGKGPGGVPGADSLGSHHGKPGLTVTGQGPGTEGTEGETNTPGQDGPAP